MKHRFVAIDVGNSTINGAIVDVVDGHLQLDEFPTQIDLTTKDDAIVNRLGEQPIKWWAVSVNRERVGQLGDWLAAQRPDDYLQVLRHHDANIALRVQFPERLGMDRVAAAIAANSLRRGDASAIIVDSGTAITVDALSREGAFLGGAILPGVGMSAAALDDCTDALPRIVPLDTPPASIGANTEEAIRSGLFWGSFGGVKELIERQRAGFDGASDLFLTGGAAVWSELLSEAQLVPNLTLHGVALMALRTKELSQ